MHGGRRGRGTSTIFDGSQAAAGVPATRFGNRTSVTTSTSSIDRYNATDAKRSRAVDIERRVVVIRTGAPGPYSDAIRASIPGHAPSSCPHPACQATWKSSASVCHHSPSPRSGTGRCSGTEIITFSAACGLAMANSIAS